MKIIYTTVLSFFLFAGVATAQQSNIGIKGGLNAFTLKPGGSANFDTKVGFHLGLFSHMHLAENIALQPELVFSTQGARYRAAGTDVDLNLNYINIPVLFQYMFDNGFRLQAGPQLGILASAKTKTNNTEINVKDNYESIDLGLAVGAGYVSPITGFGLDVRYNIGLSNIHKNGNDLFNRGLQAGVFYLFNHN